MLRVQQTVPIAPNKDQITWDARQGFQSEPLCKEQLRTILDLARKDSVNFIVIDDEYMHNPTLVLSRFACLPDTVDPRGPKGR